MVATAAATPLSAEQWSEYIRHTPLVKWVIGKFCRRYSPIAIDELRIIFEDALINAVREFDPTKSKFSRFYYRMCQQRIGNWNKKQANREKFIECIRYDPSRYETYDSEYAEPLDIRNVLEQAAKRIKMTEEQLIAVIGYLRGEQRIDAIAAEWGCSRQWVNTRVQALLSKAKQLCGVETESMVA